MLKTNGNDFYNACLEKKQALSKIGQCYKMPFDEILSMAYIIFAENFNYCFDIMNEEHWKKLYCILHNKNGKFKKDKNLDYASSLDQPIFENSDDKTPLVDKFKNHNLDDPIDIIATEESNLQQPYKLKQLIEQTGYSKISAFIIFLCANQLDPQSKNIVKPNISQWYHKWSMRFFLLWEHQASLFDHTEPIPSIESLKSWQKYHKPEV